MFKTASTLLTVLIVTLISSPAFSAGKFSCWTNKDGIRECGNVLPPEYAQKGHEEISDQGTVLKRVKRAPTKEEIAEQQRLKEEKLREQKILDEQKKRDATLMQTYNNADEIEMAKQGKLNSINNELRIFSKNLENANNRLKSLQAQAARSERNGKPVPEHLLKSIEKAKKQMDDYQKFVTKKESEKARILAQFETEIKRFRELRSARMSR